MLGVLVREDELSELSRDRLLSDTFRDDDRVPILGDTEGRLGARLGAISVFTLEEREREVDPLDEGCETVVLEELSVERIVEDDLDLEGEFDGRVTLLDPDEIRGDATSALGVTLGRTGETDGLVELDRVEGWFEERERE